MVETACKIHSTILAKRPSQDEEPWASATSLARMTADDRAPAGPSMAAAVLAAIAERTVVFVGSITALAGEAVRGGEIRKLCRFPRPSRVSLTSLLPRRARTSMLKCRGKTPTRARYELSLPRKLYWMLISP